jgi:predicted heme/steroid binding protein
MRNRSLNAIHVTLLATVLVFAGALQAQWTPGGNSTTTDISRTGKVGVMTTGTPSSQLHVFTATLLDGIAVDGSNNPAINFRNAGAIKGYLGLATAVNGFLTGTAVNDLVLRSEGGKIHIGVGTGAPTMTIANGNVSIGTTAALSPFYAYGTNTGNASKNTGEFDIDVVPTSAQTGAGIHNDALVGYSDVPSTTAVAVGTVTGTEGDAENYAATSVNTLTGTWGWVYNQNPSASVNFMSGAQGWAEVDGGSVNYAAEFWGWAGVYGGTVANLYGAYLAPNNVSGTVTNSYGVFVSPQGAATNRYGVFINDGPGVATNDYGLYQSGTGKKNYFAGNVGIGTTSPTSLLTVNGQIYSQSGGFKFPDGTVQTTASTGGGSGSVTAANVSSGSFGASTSGGNYTFPAMVGVGTTGTPSNQLHVITATNMDGVAVDGSSNPAVNFRNAGAIKGYLGLATGANAFFAGSAANDLVLRSEGGKIHIGQGTGAPTMTIAGNSLGIGNTAPYYPFHLSSTNTDTTGGSAQSGGNRAWQSAAEVDLVVKPTAAQATGAVRIGQEAWSKVDSTNTYSIGTVRGTEGDAENYGSGSVTNLTGSVGWAYNANSSANIGSIVGASVSAENDGGTVDSVYNLTTWGGINGGNVTNQFGIYNQTSGPGGAGGTLTNQYGIYSLMNGNATTRYNLFLQGSGGVVTNNWGLYQNDTTAKNYFAGNVGIGTTSPTSLLTVNGQVYSQSGGFKFPDGTVQTTASTGGGSSTVTAANVSAGSFGANVSGGNYSFPAILTVASGVGIGSVSSPIALLDLRKPIVTDAVANLLTAGYSGTPANRSIAFQQIGNASTASQYLFLNGGLGTTSTTASPTVTSSFAPAFGIEATDSGMSIVAAAAGTNVAPTRALTVNSAGHIGIGVAPSSGYVVDIAGSLRATDVIGADYQDVAEWVPAGETLTPGMVVVLNHKHNNEVLESRTSYDTSVAGVVSEHPGVVLGKSGADKAKIATTGRVKVRVDASKAAIEIGDLLVTSDLAGSAMKSEPMEINGRRFHQPGTIIGKALEPLPSGTGEILVLLSLQ